MLTLWTNHSSSRDHISRRSFLRIGGLGLGGLTWADLIRLQARETANEEPKAVIMIVLGGGPTQFETYDMKPDAPAEIRGELKPIATNVPGMDISELFPLQAQIADRMAIIRGLHFYADDMHSSHMLYTGHLKPRQASELRRPSFGSVYSRLCGTTTPAGMPSYVSLTSSNEDTSLSENPGFLGGGHQPFRFNGPMLKSLQMPKGMSLEQLAERDQLRQAFDTLRKDIDYKVADADAATARALSMIATPKVRDAFDLGKEPESVKARYGNPDASLPNAAQKSIPQKFLLARRLVEAGVPIVTLDVGYPLGWDSHEKNFEHARRWLPLLDRAVHALVTDLHERGLDKKVLVVMWGEMGRTPKINKDAGRDHWAESGFVWLAGGAGLRMGQVIGASDARGERARGKRYGVQNVLTTIYRVLGIDPAKTLPDHSGRPQYLLDEREPVSELL